MLCAGNLTGYFVVLKLVLIFWYIYLFFIHLILIIKFVFIGMFNNNAGSRKEKLTTIIIENAALAKLYQQRRLYHIMSKIMI